MKVLSILTEGKHWKGHNKRNSECHHRQQKLNEKHPKKPDKKDFEFGRKGVGGQKREIEDFHAEGLPAAPEEDQWKQKLENNERKRKRNRDDDKINA